MTEALTKRGPDDKGVWWSPNLPVALGHRRLSVLDLSRAGRQPMTSASGRSVIVLNGEIYNYRELAQSLSGRGFCFRGHSDTEVAVEAIEHWGIEEALKRFVGMFALAVWNTEHNTLDIARDRFGVKPLYYKYTRGRSLVFASQLQSFEAIGETGALNTDALAEYFKYGYVPGKQSIYAGINRLEPGMWARFSADDSGNPTLHTMQAYWELPGPCMEHQGNETEVVEQTNALLEQSVRLRLIADVPVGIFLSGGVDSALVAALAAKIGVHELRTFTIGFSEPGWPDELERAAAIARHLGADHTSWTPTSNDLRNAMDNLAIALDEPFADPSIIPTYLVSQLARQHVTVALSGDGGDEGFLGYGRYYFAPRALMRHGRWLRAVSTSGLAPGLASVGKAMSGVSSRVGRRMKAAGQLANARNSEQGFYDWAVGATDNSFLLRQHVRVSRSFTASDARPPTLLSLNARDIKQFLPDDILYKVDRASMSVSLEAREPLLDHRLVEYGWSLPTSLKLSNDGTGKLPLRAVLRRFLPDDLVDGPKRGFGAPLNQWMRQPLKQWTDRYLNADDPFTDSAVVRKLTNHWRTCPHDGRAASFLWRVAQFRAWWNCRQSPVVSITAGPLKQSRS